MTTEIETLIAQFSDSEVEQSAAPPPRELRPVVQGLSPAQRPSTVCVTCPQSLWFKSAVELRCYCRSMNLLVWSPTEPNALLDCDQLHSGSADDLQ